jgi:hypothetical protein
MDANNLNNIKARYAAFYDNSAALPDIEDSLFKFLFNEILIDIRSKNIRNFHEWLKYYSTDGTDFEPICKLASSYYEKVLQQKFDDIIFDEKVLMFNALALYSIEMDVDPVEDARFRGTIFQTFIEIIEHYKLVLGGYLSLKGQILISDRNKCTFYSVWSANGVNKETPITLF